MWGFTRSEQRATLFLLSTFGLGVLVWWYCASQPPPAIDAVELAALENFMRTALEVDSSRGLPPTSLQATNGVAAEARIDLNAATYNDLVKLPGIGPVMAKRIIDFRATHGGFKRLQDLRKVKGVGAKTYEKLAPLLIVR